jgi:hypothetical protein
MAVAGSGTNGLKSSATGFQRINYLGFSKFIYFEIENSIINLKVVSLPEIYAECYYVTALRVK